MTEAEWAAGTDPTRMVEFLKHRVSYRKLRLYAVACVRRRPPARFTKFHWDVVEEVEDSVDGGWQMPEPEWGVGPVLGAVLYTNAFRAARHIGDRTVGVGGEEKAEDRRTQCQLLRDIFDDLFRPVSLAPPWRTSTAVLLARQMYESRDFTAMPILADALQDAGCDHPDVLAHCQGTGPHVRGCWVVDLVLGKS